MVKEVSRHTFDSLEIRRQFYDAINRPDAQIRQESLFRTYEQVINRATSLGITNIFLMGALASPALRDYRPHDDCDFFVPNKDECFDLINSLNYTKKRPLVLHGSSLHYLVEPSSGIPIETRYAIPVSEISTGTVFKYRQPYWSHIFMPKPLIMPPSALSGKDELRSWRGIESRYVYDEYNYLIKSLSKYPKDQIDAEILLEQGLDPKKIQQILKEISSVKGSLTIPPILIKLIRSFGFWNLPKKDYRLLHGLIKKN